MTKYTIKLGERTVLSFVSIKITISFSHIIGFVVRLCSGDYFLSDSHCCWKTKERVSSHFPVVIFSTVFIPCFAFSRHRHSGLGSLGCCDTLLQNLGWCCKDVLWKGSGGQVKASAGPPLWGPQGGDPSCLPPCQGWQVHPSLWLSLQPYDPSCLRRTPAHDFRSLPLNIALLSQVWFASNQYIIALCSGEVHITMSVDSCIDSIHKWNGFGFQSNNRDHVLVAYSRL